MLNPYVEGNVYPFVVYFFWLSCCLGLARRAPFGGGGVLRTYRRATGGDRKPQVMRAAVSCSNSSNVFAHAKALYNICPAIVCKSHARYIQKSSKNLTQINEKSSPRRSESMQIRPCSTKSMPDCRQKLPESIFR